MLTHAQGRVGSRLTRLNEAHVDDLIHIPQAANARSAKHGLVREAGVRVILRNDCLIVRKVILLRIIRSIRPAFPAFELT